MPHKGAAPLPPPHVPSRPALLQLAWIAVTFGGFIFLAVVISLTISACRKRRGINAHDVYLADLVPKVPTFVWFGFVVGNTAATFMSFAGDGYSVLCLVLLIESSIISSGILTYQIRYNYREEKAALPRTFPRMRAPKYKKNTVKMLPIFAINLDILGLAYTFYG